MKLEEARQRLEEARHALDSALKVAEEAGLESDVWELHAEQGKVYRELGLIVSRLEGLAKGTVYYRQSEDHLNRASGARGVVLVNRADILQDLAEERFRSGDYAVAQRRLQEVEELIGSEYRIVPGEHVPGSELPSQYFWPLGKVERLRGEMAFTQEQFEQGLQHYVLAYAYFVRFSPDAVQKDDMLESLYIHLRDLPIERQQALVESVRAWTQEHDIGVDVGSFVEILESLLGV
jgi:tetratricopeptide (TPR) repeat protein